MRNSLISHLPFVSHFDKDEVSLGNVAHKFLPSRIRWNAHIFLKPLSFVGWALRATKS